MIASAVVLADADTDLEAGVSAEMAWTTIQYTRTQVDRAGMILAHPEPELFDYFHALEVINNWRSSHSFPLNTFTVGLKDRTKRIDPNALVAQRIKRLASIAHKLERFNSMKLSQMQDIGGCRAIVESTEDVYRL